MNTSLPKVGIIVLNYNGQACLLRCLDSLLRLCYQNFFIVVVDNASEDDSFLSAKEHFPHVLFIANKTNIGFAAGMNMGISAALEKGAQYVWLLNNDAVVESDTLSFLIDAAQECPKAGLLSPYIFNASTGILWFGKGIISFFRMRAVHVLPRKREQALRWHESGFLTGCALLIKKEVFSAIGVLDEVFFLYYEDADFSIRARARGFMTIAVPKSRVFHAEQSEKNIKKLYYLVLSGLLFFEKHANPFFRLYFILYGTMRRLKNAIDVARGKKEALVVRQALNDFYYGR